MRSGQAIEVLDGGALTSVQDALGRQGWRRLGIPVGGAVDAWSARLANRLVGNPDHAALLEATLLGPRLRFLSPALVGIAGADLEATLDGRPVPPGISRLAAAGNELRFGAPRSGARAYVAVAGGIVVRPVLGSASTDLRSRFGGLEGRALRAGDRLATGPPGDLAPRRALRPARDGGSIRVLPGPHPEAFGSDLLDRLTAIAWSVSSKADRAGVRLDGPPLPPVATPEVPSLALPAGAVQVPPDGAPIVMLADRPVTGGYPVAACVIGADIGRVAQLATGDELRFGVVTPAEARAALERDEASLAEIAMHDDEGAGWAGALD